MDWTRSQSMNPWLILTYLGDFFAEIVSPFSWRISIDLVPIPCQVPGLFIRTWRQAFRQVGPGNGNRFRLSATWNHVDCNRNAEFVTCYTVGKKCMKSARIKRRSVVLNGMFRLLKRTLFRRSLLQNCSHLSLQKSSHWTSRCTGD